MKSWLKIAVALGLAAVLVAILAIGFGSPSGLAAPGGNGNGKAIGLANGNGDDGGNGGGKVSATITIAEGYPHFGTEVVFAVDASVREKDLAKLAVTAKCYQNGTLVYRETVGVRDGLAGPFTLGPTSAWTGGDAECIAYVWLWPDAVTQLATIEFTAEA